MSNFRDIKEDGTYSINDNTASINSGSGFGFPGGNMGGFNGQIPNGEFDPNNMPEGFDPNNMPEGMERPNGDWGNFDPNNLPEGFDPNNMPEGMERPNGDWGNFDPSQILNGSNDPNALDENMNV